MPIDLLLDIDDGLMASLRLQATAAGATVEDYIRKIIIDNAPEVDVALSPIEDDEPTSLIHLDLISR